MSVDTGSVTIQIRISKKRKAELRKIASEVGMTLSGFLRQAALFEANRVLAAHRPVTQDDHVDG